MRFSAQIESASCCVAGLGSSWGAQSAALQRHFGELPASGAGPLLSRGEARALRGRVLIVNGEADDFFLPDSGRQLAATVPRSRLELLAGAGHLGPLGPPHADRLWALVGETARR